VLFEENTMCGFTPISLLDFNLKLENPLAEAHQRKIFRHWPDGVIAFVESAVRQRSSLVAVSISYISPPASTCILANFLLVMTSPPTVDDSTHLILEICQKDTKNRTILNQKDRQELYRIHSETTSTNTRLSFYRTDVDKKPFSILDQYDVTSDQISFDDGKPMKLRSWLKRPLLSSL
jgi:hypothetical protein